MKIRKAKISDLKQIHKLINEYAKKEEMIPRPLSELYENMRDFIVCEYDANICGVCALHIMWEDLAEIRSLAVDSGYQKMGIGRNLVRQCFREAKLLGLQKVFALTYHPEFFKKLGFLDIDKSGLPQKIWLQLMLLPKDPRDERNVILEIRAGTGGEEAALFGASLFRIYSKYAESRRWKIEVIDSSPTGLGGLKEVVANITGKGAYSRQKYESGVHRVQRVPVTEASGRIHTSAASVAVLPEAEEVDIKVDEKDLRIDTFCASGPGGQGVNTTYSAVRITHIPTGMVVQCQDER